MSNPYFGYTYSVFTRILIPILIVFALEQRKYLVLAVSVLYLVLFYLFGAHKTVLAGLILLLLLYPWTYRQTVFNIVRLSTGFLILFMILAAFSYDYPWILTFRRVHFLPALLDIIYVDFFEENYLYWSESIFKSLINYPFDLDHKRQIGLVYFGNSEVAANNGLISDGFMNFGTVGVFINIFKYRF
jgi:hypothetical protein